MVSFEFNKSDLNKEGAMYYTDIKLTFGGYVDSMAEFVEYCRAFAHCLGYVPETIKEYLGDE